MARLRLVKITCKDEQDWIGSDEPFLVVGGQVVWRAEGVDAGESLNLESIPESRFFASTKVELYEADGEVEEGNYAVHDKIGEWSVSEQLVGKGEQSLTFAGSGAEYVLTFFVFP